MSEWNPSTEEISSYKAPHPWGGLALGLLGLLAAAGLIKWLLSPRPSEPAVDRSIELLSPFTARLARGLLRSPGAPTMDELDLMEALSADARFRKGLYLDRRLQVRWSNDPGLISKRWEKPGVDGFPHTQSILSSLENRKPALITGPQTLREVVYPVMVGDEVGGFFCVSLDVASSTDAIRLPPLVEASPIAPAVSKAPRALEDLQRADEEKRAVARNYYLAGVIHYGSKAWDKARSAWSQAYALDPANMEVVAALRKLDREHPAPQGEPAPPSTLDPNRPQLAQEHYARGVDYFRRKDYAKARFEWALAKSLDPDNPDIAAALERLTPRGERNAPQNTHR